MTICRSCPREIKPTGKSGRPSPVCKWCRTRKVKTIHSCRRCKNALPEPELKPGMKRARWPRFCEGCRKIQAQESYGRSVQRLKASNAKLVPFPQSRRTTPQAPKRQTELLVGNTHGGAIKMFDAMMKACR